MISNSPTVWSFFGPSAMLIILSFFVGFVIVLLISQQMMKGFSLGIYNGVSTKSCGHCFSAVVLLGDFNAHYNFGDTSTPNTDIRNKLFNFLECNSLYQLVDEPTRITPTGESILDLIISDSPGFFISSGSLSPPANCDHNIVYATLNCRKYKPRSFPRKVWNFKNIDSSALNNALLNANWDEIFGDTSCDIDTLYENVFSLFVSIVESFIPRRNVIRPSDKPWMSNEIRRAIRKRDRLLRVYSRVKLDCAWERYRVQRNTVVSLIRLTKMNYNSKINQALSDPLISAKRWWGIVKSMYGNKYCSSIPAISEGDSSGKMRVDRQNHFNPYSPPVKNPKNP